MIQIPFTPSPTHTIGTELELQLIDLASCDLSDKGTEIINQYNDERHVKEELTLSTVELNTGIHNTPFTLHEELNNIALNLSNIALSKNCGLCGGGRHLSNDWKNQTITPTKRYLEVYQHTGFLAKLSCVFGQHIHIGVKTGDDAIYLCHALIAYMPHFIALSASSPYYQSEDTLFSSSRFSALNSFNTFGYIEKDITDWNKFEEYVDEAVRLDVIRSLKDIYWEIRPKPEFGTIEIRVCDTPLTTLHAAMIVGYAQLLVKYLLANRVQIKPTYESINRANTFNAQRYGFEADYIDTHEQVKTKLKEHMKNTLSSLQKTSDESELKVINYLNDYIKTGANDADRLRSIAKDGIEKSDIIKTMINLLVPSSKHN